MEKMDILSSSAAVPYSRLYWLLLNERLCEVASALPHDLCGALTFHGCTDSMRVPLGTVHLLGSRTTTVTEIAESVECTVDLNEELMPTFFDHSREPAPAISTKGDATVFLALLDAIDQCVKPMSWF